MGHHRRVGAVAVAVCAVLGAALVPASESVHRVVVPQRPAVVRTPPTISLDLPYVDDGVPAHRLDLFVPGGYETPRPMVVFIHGGSWKHGSKSAIVGGTGERVDVFRDVLLRNGFAVASVEYRFTRVARFPAQLHDVKAAVRYLRSRAGDFHLDPTRIAVAGESAGGHLAQLVAYTGDTWRPELEGDLGVIDQSSSVAAVVSYYGISDLSRVVSDRVAAECPAGQQGATSPEGRLVGGDPASPRMASIVRAANPVSYVSYSSPPTLLLHGTRDCLVPQAQSRRLYKLLDTLGADVEYISVDAPHGGPRFHTTPAVSTRVVDFLRRSLDVN